VGVQFLLVPATRQAAIAFDRELTSDAADGFNASDDEMFDELTGIFESDDAVDVGKHFEAVQAILGPSIPDSDQFWDGDVYGDDDAFGKVNFTPPDIVARIADDFAAITYQVASDRYDAAMLLGGMLFPAVWAIQGDANDSKAQSIQRAQDVAALYRRAAAEGLGVLAIFGS
jgi:Domain of unknown function (DUF1877)